jgi:hypothetical protein
MHPSPKTLLAAAILLLASVSIAQQSTPSTEAALLGRLSYDNSGFAQPGSVVHVCFAVSRNGDYRILRSRMTATLKVCMARCRRKNFATSPTCCKLLNSGICRGMVAV